MSKDTERIQRFTADIADMRLRDPASGRDRLLVRLGTLGMLAGIGIAVYAWFLAHGSVNHLEQRDAIVQAVLGLTVATVGAALFVKAAMAGFLRFWMARLCYEQQAQTDRLLAGRGSDVPPAATIERSNSGDMESTGSTDTAVSEAT